MLTYNHPISIGRGVSAMTQISYDLDTILGYSVSVTNATVATWTYYWIHSVGSKYLLLWANSGSDGTNTSSSYLYAQGFMFLDSTDGFTGQETFGASAFTDVVKANMGVSSIDSLKYVSSVMGGNYGGNYAMYDIDNKVLAYPANRTTMDTSSSYANGFLIDEKDGKLLILSGISIAGSHVDFLCYDGESRVVRGRVNKLTDSNTPLSGVAIILMGLNRCFSSSTTVTNLGYDYNCFADSRLFSVLPPASIAYSMNHLIALGDGSIYYRLGQIAYQISS